MNNLYDYFNKIIKKDKITHSFLIGNVRFDDVKNDLYKIFNTFIFDSNVDIESNPDIYIIRPEKGNISKDSIKELISEISITSQFNNKKVYVIDESERLNDYSYNAILKTLEEPKENIYAFLLTTNMDSIKETISSRCQKIFISTDAGEVEYDENVIELGNKMMEYLEKNNIKIIYKHHEIYNNIENREMFVNILNYMLSYYFKKINECISNNENDDIKILSKKVLVINESINELKSPLNKNLSIDRFIIKMWRCLYENS